MPHDIQKLKTLTEAGLENVVEAVNDFVRAKNDVESNVELVDLAGKSIAQLEAGGLSTELATLVFDTMAALRRTRDAVKTECDSGAFPPQAV